MAMYVGLDVHKKTCHATVMDERGEVIKQEKFLNEREEFERVFKDINDAKAAISPQKQNKDGGNKNTWSGAAGKLT